jgi:tetratricopeptide (TPR) repeat protein
MKKTLAIAFTLGMSAGAWAQPKPKTQEEINALQAAFQATTPDAQIAAAQSALEKFADTEFKSMLLQLIASDYQRKGDFAKTVTYGEQALSADPKNFEAMLILGNEYARNTKESDFDKQDKLKKAEEYANNAINAIKTAPKPNEQLPDAQWEGVKKDVAANGHEILGQVAMVRKQPEVAVTEFKTAAETAANPEPATLVRLAAAYNVAGKYDEAIEAANKAMNAPNAAPAVKQFAQAERARATQAKNKGNAAATTPANPATPPAAPAAPPK